MPSALDVRGVVVTAEGGSTPFDFVSRWFGALAGVPEDPVTGSAHCQLGPLWAERLGRQDVVARQVSARGGTVQVQVVGERVRLTGDAVRYLDGHVTIPNEQLG